MRVRWSVDAADDLERIHQRLWLEKPETAGQVIRTIYESCISLKNLPARGRIGKEPNSRELILSPLPWIVVYRNKGEFVEISRIWHAAQNRP